MALRSSDLSVAGSVSRRWCGKGSKEVAIAALVGAWDTVASDWGWDCMPLLGK